MPFEVPFNLLPDPGGKELSSNDWIFGPRNNSTTISKHGNREGLIVTKNAFEVNKKRIGVHGTQTGKPLFQPS